MRIMVQPVPQRKEGETRMPGRREGDSLRLLVVQTSNPVSSEVRVLHNLLVHLQRLSDVGEAPPVDVLLMQGIDWHAGPEAGRMSAKLFRQIPGVTVHEIRSGKLGEHDTPRLQRLMKVGDVFNLQRNRAQIVRAAQAFRPDLVYSSQQHWDLRLATPLARTVGCPQVIHLHYIVGPWLGRHAVDRLRQADMVIGVSDFIRGDALEHGASADRVHTLYNSIVIPRELTASERAAVKKSLCAELSVPEESVLVGMTARLNQHKGQEELVQAMLPILARDRRVHLLLAGSENPVGAGMPARIRRMAQGNGVLAQVHLLGRRCDVPRILDGLDIFAHPSRFDPCPLAVLEAAAHGLPVVAWREGGIATLVLDQQTGLLVKPMDCEGLTRALDTLIADEQLRISMGRSARTRAARLFKPEGAAASFLSLLRTAASGAAQGVVEQRLLKVH